MHESTRQQLARTTIVAGLTGLIGLTALAGDCEPHWDASPGQPGFSSTQFSGAYVSSFAVFDGGFGNGDELYAAGGFTKFGATPVTRVGRWSGGTWHDVGFNLMNANWINDITAFDGHLYVGGVLDGNGGLVGGLGRWAGVGSKWEVPGGGVSSATGSTTVWSFGLFDDGSGEALYVGGRFEQAGLPGQTIAVNNIAKWDGQNWHDVGGGVSGWPDPPGNLVSGMTVWDDGRGPALYVAGRFSTAGGQPANHIARWDGESWEAVGGGAFNTGGVSALAVFDDGTGSALYATGNQFNAAGIPNTPLAKWDGQSWTIPGGPVTGFGRGLAVFDDGDGPALYYAGGGAIGGSGLDCGRVARWDGTSWSCPDGGLSGGSSAIGMQPFDDGDGPALFIGGSFTETGDGQPAGWAAAWRGCEPDPDTCPGDLTGDGNVGVADLLALLACWGPVDSGSDCEAADLTDDGNVGVADLLALLSAWGRCP